MLGWCCWAVCPHRGWGTNWVLLIIIAAVFLCCRNSICLDNVANFCLCLPCNGFDFDCPMTFVWLFSTIHNGTFRYVGRKTSSNILNFTFWTYNWFWAGARLMITTGHQKVTNDNKRVSKERQIIVMSYCREWRYNCTGQYGTYRVVQCSCYCIYVLE